MSFKTRTIAAILTVLSMAPAWAAVIEADSASQTDNYNAVISATDLINAGQASLLSATQSGNFNESDGHGLGGTHDGIGQDGTSQAHTAFTYNQAVTLTYSLDTNASAGGYTLTAVDVVTGWWGAADFAHQSWTVSVATVANPTVFTQLAVVGYYPYPGQYENTYGYAHVRLTDGTGALASGISAIQFSLDSVPSIISEIDVTGFATPVPEPASLVLLLAGLCGVGMRHRRPANR